MADKITFLKKINDSVQVRDELYYSKITPAFCSVDPLTNITKTLCDTANGTWTDLVIDAPISLGEIIDMGEKWVKVDATSITGYTQSNPELITNGGFDVTYGSEKVTDGSFDNVANDIDVTTLDDWEPYGTVDARTIQNNQLVLTTPAGNTGVYLNPGAVSGQAYHVTAITSGNTGANGVYITNTAAGAVNHSTDGGVDFYFTATSLASAIYFRAGDNEAGTINIDNVSVKEVISSSTSEWTHDANWDITSQSHAVKIPGAAGYLTQDLAASLVKGEEYTLEMEIVGGSPADGDIKIISAATGGADVDVIIDTDVGTATWIQGSTNTDKIRIWQDSGGDAEIDNITLSMTSFDFETALAGTTPDNLFFMFRKPVAENVSSLKGYYAESTFTNNSTAKQELFVVGSEVTISSK